MKKFDYSQFKYEKYNSEIINLIAKIHEYKGKQELYLKKEPQILDRLTNLAIIQSTDASNKIEGISTSNSRLHEIVQKKSKPISRNEREIAGYRDVLNLIHDNYENIDLSVNNILQLHKELYTYLDNNFKGKWKVQNNIISEEDSKGNKFVRFEPAEALLTPDLMKQLVDEYNKAIGEGMVDPLILIPCFILDFLSIHPFTDGNGRISRLLTLLLLYREGYLVGKYISIEMFIEKTKETYYDELQQSSIGWHENNQDYTPFLRYMLGMIMHAYEEFEDRVHIVYDTTMTAKDRVEQILYNSLIPLSRSDIMVLAPNYVEKTIYRALQALTNDGKIRKVGAGRSTKYIKVDK